MNTPPLIIFDCDGTLVDTEQLSALAFSNVLRGHGLDYTADAIRAEFLGTANTVILEILRKRHGLPLPEEAIIAAYVPEMDRLMDAHMRVLPESRAYVAGLIRRGIPVAVASNGTKSVVHAELRRAGYLDFIPEDRVFTFADVARPKPYPDLFLHAARTLGYAPGQCIVVEDSPTGVRAGLAAGMRVAGYTGLAHDPHAAAQALEKEGANPVLCDLGALEGALL